MGTVLCRVEGCGEPRRVIRTGFCQRHHGRYVRTGKTGPLGIIGADVLGKHPTRDRARARILGALIDRYGTGRWMLYPGCGSYTVRAGRGRAREEGQVANSTISALARRGWIELTEYGADGTRGCRPTAPGKHAAILAARALAQDS